MPATARMRTVDELVVRASLNAIFEIVADVDLDRVLEFNATMVNTSSDHGQLPGQLRKESSHRAHSSG